MWALDFQFDVTADGKIIKLLNVTDEHTREVLAVRVARTIDTDATVAVLDEIVAQRGSRPQFIRCDNGPALTAHAVADWCPSTWCRCPLHRPGEPWQNAWVESFNSRLRDECLATEQFDSLLEAQVVIEDWRIDYNHRRPHSSLGMLDPADYAATLDQD